MSEVSNILQTYIDNNSGNECPPQYHRWAFISATAACLGRRIRIKFGHKYLFPNMYVVLVGLPATRKSHAIDIVEDLLKASEYNKFAFTKTSREKFLMDFHEGFENRTATGEIDLKSALDTPLIELTEKKKESGNFSLLPSRECFVCADELLDFLGMKNYSFFSTLTTLWDNKDKYAERLKRSLSVNIPRPYLNMLGGFTPQNLNLCIPSEMIGQGATSRFVFIHANKPDRRITFPRDMSEEIKDETIEFFKKAQHFEGTCEITPEAEEMIDAIYQNFEELPDARLHHYCSRRLIHLLKLCMVMAVINHTTTIDADIVEHANTILVYTESSMPQALGEFGESKTGRASQRVMEVLQTSNRPLTVAEIWARVTQDIDKLQTLGEILESLANAQKIIGKKSVTHEQVFILNKDLGKINHRHTNFERWINEYE